MLCHSKIWIGIDLQTMILKEKPVSTPPPPPPPQKKKEEDSNDLKSPSWNRQIQFHVSGDLTKKKLPVL